MLTLLQAVAIQQTTDTLGTVANWATIIATIFTTLFVIVALLWVGVPRGHGYWLRRKKRWPVTVRMTSFVGRWEPGQIVEANYSVTPRWRTWSNRHFPRVTKALLIGEFAGSSHPENPRPEPFYRQIIERIYPPNNQEPVENLVRLKIADLVAPILVDMKLLRAYVVVIVKYPPHEDFVFKTDLSTLIEGNVGVDFDGYGRRFR